MDTRNRAHFILTWTSQLRKVMSMKALPKNRLYWYTKFTPKPTRYTARFTVSKNIKDPPSTVCHSQRWMINPMFSYLKTPDSQNPILSENSSFWWFKKNLNGFCFTYWIVFISTDKFSHFSSSGRRGSWVSSCMEISAGRIKPWQTFLPPSVGLEGFEVRTDLTGMF